MWTTCWNCGEEIWLETQRTCRHCDAVTRRCADCSNYKVNDSTCDALNIEVGRYEAANPSRLSLSYNCQSYTLDEAAVARRQAKAPVAAAAAPTATAAKPAVAAARAAPTQAAQPASPAVPAGAEVITIIREPAMRRPQHPVIIAHRGASAEAPENTVAAFRAAQQAGTQAIEFDVHITRDNQLVVIHDATVDRCTNGTGAVKGMTLPQLKALDAGSWFAPSFNDQHIPTLAEAVTAIPAPLWMIIHLRDHENETDRCERALAKAIATQQCRNRTIVSHNTRHGVQRLRELDPKLRLCWIPPTEDGHEYVDDAYLLGCRFIQPTLQEVTTEMVQYAHEQGMWINVFWADEVEDMQRLIKLEVDGIITNYPRRLRETLRAAASERPATP